MYDYAFCAEALKFAHSVQEFTDSTIAHVCARLKLMHVVCTVQRNAHSARVERRYDCHSCPSRSHLMHVVARRNE